MYNRFSNRRRIEVACTFHLFPCFIRVSSLSPPTNITIIFLIKFRYNFLISTDTGILSFFIYIYTKRETICKSLLLKIRKKHWNYLGRNLIGEKKRSTINVSLARGINCETIINIQDSSGLFP